MLKVLVVDDDSPIRRWLEYCISQLEGFVLVGAAATGNQGLEVYRRELPDIVITDIEMPGMSGLEMVARIQAIHPTHIIILTSHDTFSYARQALQNGTAEYILKTEITLEKMRDLLCKAARAIQHNGDSAVRREQGSQLLIRQLALQQNAVPLTVQELRRQGIPLEDGPLAAGDLMSRNAATLQEARNCVERCHVLTHLRFVPLGYEHLLFVGNLCTEDALDQLQELYERETYGLPCVLGLSGEKSGLAALSAALHEAQARGQLHFYAPERRVFLRDALGVEGIRHAETARMNFSKELFAQNYQGAFAVKDRVLRQIEEERPTDVDAVKKLCSSFCTILLHFSTEKQEELDHGVAEVEAAIHAARTMQALRSQVEAVFAPFAQKTLQINSYSPAIRDAIAYIKAHYHEKLSLGLVAQAVNFNAEYFSRLFVRETGMNFSAYLNGVRMRQAVELLEHTDKKVYEIAEEVGYASLSYFSTAFKKSFGRTPAEFQALRQKSGQTVPAPQTSDRKDPNPGSFGP